MTDGEDRATKRALPPQQATAGERLNRVLAILVYLARVGEAQVADLAARFSVSATELLHDLELVACCGVPPYTPDQLIDLLIDEDRVVAEGLRELAHPRRFTPEEGFALAAAARALLAVPGADDEGDLAGALAKLEAVLGSSSLAVEVDSSPALAPLQKAVSAGEQVEIDYFGASATEPSTRVVDPYQVVVRESKWYLDAWCHKAEGLRRFQVDRVRAVRPTGTPAGLSPLTASEQEALSRPEAFLGASEAVMVTVVFPAEARFAVEGLVTNGLELLDDGRMMAVIPVSDTEGWFGRLLLRLGPHAEVIDPPELVDVAARARAPGAGPVSPVGAGGRCSGPSGFVTGGTSLRHLPPAWPAPTPQTPALRSDISPRTQAEFYAFRGAGGRGVFCPIGTMTRLIR